MEVEFRRQVALSLRKRCLLYEENHTSCAKFGDSDATVLSVMTRLSKDKDRSKSQATRARVTPKLRAARGADGGSRNSITV